MARFKYNLGLILAALVVVAGCFYIYFEHYTHYRPDTQTEVTLWYTDSDVMGRNFGKLTEKYNSDEGEKYGIKVTLRAFNSRAELYDTVSQCVEKKSQLPDIIICDSDFAAYLDGHKKLASLDEHFGEWEKSSFNDRILSASMQDDKLLLIPVGAETSVFLVNNEMFGEFDSVNSFEKLCSVAGEYYGRNSKPFFSMGDYSMFFRTAMAQLGDDFDASNPRNTDNDNSKYIYNTLADAAFSRGYADMVNPAELVIKGELPCAIVTSPQAMAFADEVKNEQIGINMLPLMKNGKNVYYERIIGAAVIKSDAAKEKSAATFIDWLTAQDNIETLTAGSGYIPAVGSMSDSKKYKLNSELCDTINAAVKQGKAVAFSPDGEYSVNSRSFDAVLKTIMSSLN